MSISEDYYTDIFDFLCGYLKYKSKTKVDFYKANDVIKTAIIGLGVDMLLTENVFSMDELVKELHKDTGNFYPPAMLEKWIEKSKKHLKLV